MSVTQITTRDTLLEKERYGLDLTMLENDGGTLKVSVGSLIEAGGALYVVQTAAATPTGVAGAGAYLFFDPSVPGFVWSAVAGTYSAAKGGIYNGSSQRQCRFLLTGATTWEQLVTPEASTIRAIGALAVTGAFTADATVTVSGKISMAKGIGTAHYLSGNLTQNQIFDALVPYLPNNGDDLLVYGGYGTGGAAYLCHNAHKLTPTIITLSWVKVDGSCGGTNVTDGDATTYTVGMRW